jgi:hypothetical protein
MSGARRSSRLRYDVQSPWATGGSGWNALYTHRISVSSILLLSSSLSHLLCRSVCTRERAMHTRVQPRYVRAHTCMHVHVSAHLFLSLTPLFLSLHLPFSALLSLPPQEQRIMLFRFTYTRLTVPISRYTVVYDAGDTGWHFGIASRIFPPASCLFDKVIILYFSGFNTTFWR